MIDCCEYSLKVCDIIRSNVGMCDIYKTIHILSNVMDTSDLDGDIVEMGCFEGRTSLAIRAIDNKRQIHLYDSFEGLPDKTEYDGNSPNFNKGDLKSSEQLVKDLFQIYNLNTPVIHKGFFSSLTSVDIPDKISFAYLDGDFYESILCSLTLIYDKVVCGGIILIDDYDYSELPGVKLAVDEFIFGKQDYSGELLKKTTVYKMKKL